MAKPEIQSYNLPVGAVRNHNMSWSGYSGSRHQVVKASPPELTCSVRFSCFFVFVGVVNLFVYFSFVWFA
jgi:hypothetical protein